MAVRGWSTTERWQRERKLGMNGKSGLIQNLCHADPVEKQEDLQFHGRG